MADADHEKRAAAVAAIEEVRAGMLVGLGTGSTVAFAIAALAERCRQGLIIEAVATSLRTEAAAIEQGITVRDFADVSAVDLAIDGIDAIDPSFRAIKGAGGAMLREKIVAQSASRMIAIGDGSKAVAQLPSGPLPVEVLPFGQAFVAKRISDLGGRALLRSGPGGTVVHTDQGNVVLDCTAPADLSLELFVEQLQSIAGVMGHGFFADEIDALYIGRGQSVERFER